MIFRRTPYAGTYRLVHEGCYVANITKSGVRWNPVWSAQSVYQSPVRACAAGTRSGVAKMLIKALRNGGTA